MGEGRSEMDSNDSPILGYECPMTDGLLGPEVPRRPYEMLQRVATKRRGNREIGEHRNRKVTLESVQGAVRRSKCARKCLSKLPELMILTHRYEAWKSKSYADRRQWILQILREAKVDPGEGGGRLTFAMKVNGHSVCNRCYADATGYSQRQFMNLKQSIRTHNRSSSEHGNNRRSREHSNIAACRAVLDNFFKECGCSQPNRHAKRLSDGKYVPLVLLPMHTQREDVLHMVNMAIPTMGATKKVSKARFDRMWHREFTNVQIPPVPGSRNVKSVGNTKNAWMLCLMNGKSNEFVEVTIDT